ncbi:MAG: hypothetical protein ABI616_05070 [Pseudomonadota bacterium]
MSDTCSDIESVERAAQTAGWRRIGIDGVHGSGKSHLAEMLSEVLECPHLEVEDYLHKNQGGYVDFIDYAALASALSSLATFVLSGVCLREVLVNAGADVDGNIYIKRSLDGIWVDEDQCVFPDGIDAAIESLARDRAMVSQYFDEPPEHAAPQGGDDEAPFAEEIMRYHDSYIPQDDADLVFERDINNG